MQTKREKILVAVAVTLALAALAYHLMPPLAHRGGQGQEENGSTLEESFPKLPETARQAAILSGFDKEIPMASPGFSFMDSNTSKYMYTGYLRLGDRTYAVIDGKEYVVGDVLDDGLSVVAVERDYVMAEGRDRATGRPLRVRVPRSILPDPENKKEDE